MQGEHGKHNMAENCFSTLNVFQLAYKGARKGIYASKGKPNKGNSLPSIMTSSLCDVVEEATLTLSGVRDSRDAQSSVNFSGISLKVCSLYLHAIDIIQVICDTSFR